MTQSKLPRIRQPNVGNKTTSTPSGLLSKTNSVEQSDGSILLLDSEMQRVEKVSLTPAQKRVAEAIVVFCGIRPQVRFTRLWCPSGVERWVIFQCPSCIGPYWNPRSVRPNLSDFRRCFSVAGSSPETTPSTVPPETKGKYQSLSFLVSRRIWG